MLQLTLDQLTGDFKNWSGAAQNAVTVRWPSTFDFRLKMAQGSVVEQLGDSASGEIEIRRTNNNALLAKISTWARVGSGAAAYYVFRINLSTVAINPLFDADATLAEIPAKLELRWLRGDGTDERSASLPIRIVRAGNVGALEIPVEPGQFDGRKVITVSKGGAATDTRTGLSPYDMFRPFASLAAAKAAAASGDTIRVEPGSYVISASLAKNGVNWHFDDGTNVVFSSTDTGEGIWDDNSIALTCSVSGKGVFLRESIVTNVSANTVRVNHANSLITIECKTISLHLEAVTDESGGAAVFQENGKIYVLAEDIIATSANPYERIHAVWWINGEGHVFANRIVGIESGLYASVQDSPTGDFFVTADEISGNSYGFLTYGVDLDAAIWIKAGIIRSGDISVSALQGCKVYIEVQKLFGRILLQNTTPVYIRADKIEAVSSGVSGTPNLLLVSNESLLSAWVSINHWTSGSFIGNSIEIQGGANLQLLNMKFTTPNNAHGIEISGGNTTFVNPMIDTSTNSSTDCLACSGGVITLINPVLRSNAGRKDLVNSGSGVIKTSGGFGSGSNGLFTNTGTISRQVG